MQNIYLFLFDGLADYEIAHLTTGLLKKEFLLEPERYRLVTFALRPGTVKTMGGLNVVPDLVISQVDLDVCAMLVLPGGEAWAGEDNRNAIDLAVACIARRIPVAAICWATLALARAGQLDQRYHTSNYPGELDVSGYRGAAFYRKEPVVEDDNVITAGGLHGIDFAARIFQRLNLMTPEVLTAYSQLFKTADPACFYQLMAAVESARH